MKKKLEEKDKENKKKISEIDESILKIKENHMNELK
jgi:hypothetical protein